MTEHNTNYQNISVSEDENAQVTIEGELTTEAMDSARTQALENIRQNAEVDGFRKGSAPDDVLINKYGDMTILQEAAEVALSQEYPNILRDYQIQAIGQPQVSITKMQPGEPLGFKITTARMPDVNLPDYKAIATEELSKDENKLEEVEVTDQEVEDTILQIRRNVAQQQQQQSGIEVSDQDDALPELTDDFVKQLGDFQDVDDFKTKLRENVRQQKQNQQHEKRRLAVMDGIIEKADIQLPDVIVSGELDKMIQQLKDDVKRAGMEFEQYTEQLGKSEEQIREEWKPQAEKKAKTQLILNKIATEENITPDQDEINQQVEQILQQHEDANREQAKVFVETQLTNEKVLQMLENQAPAGGSKEDTQQSDQKEEESANESTESTEQSEDSEEKPKSKKGSGKKGGSKKKS